jgi:hypothetical protein
MLFSGLLMLQKRKQYITFSGIIKTGCCQSAVSVFRDCFQILEIMPGKRIFQTYSPYYVLITNIICSGIALGIYKEVYSYFMKKYLHPVLILVAEKIGFCDRMARNALLIAGLFCIPAFSQAQLGNWTFNNVLSGTGSTYNTVNAASLGSAITTGAYNGGTVFFGEDGWPSGALDPNAYLEFALTPISGRSLSLLSINMLIRRSTTGTAAGSGPNNWALRSSLDGYASDITNGTLNLSTTPTTVAILPLSFTGLTSTISFRLYGYNSTVSTGGLNRFVYDNITANGNTLLPVLIQNFQADVQNNQAVQLSWILNGDEPAAAIQVERSENGSDYKIIKDIVPAQSGLQQQYHYTDEAFVSYSLDFYYRIKITSNTGNIYYSAVQKISFAGDESFSISVLPARRGENIRVKFKADKATNYSFSLYNFNGTRLGVKIVTLNAGTQLVTMDNAAPTGGIYVLVAERSGRKAASKISIAD